MIFNEVDEFQKRLSKADQWSTKDVIEHYEMLNDDAKTEVKLLLLELLEDTDNYLKK